MYKVTCKKCKLTEFVRDMIGVKYYQKTHIHFLDVQYKQVRGSVPSE